MLIKKVKNTAVVRGNVIQEIGTASENNVYSAKAVDNKLKNIDKHFNIYSTESTKAAGTSYPYRKILTIKLSKAYDIIFFNFTAVEAENIGFIFDGQILVKLNSKKEIQAEKFTGEYSYKNLDAKMILYREEDTTGNTILSLYCYMPFNWRTVQLSISDILGTLGIDAIESDNSYSSSEPTYKNKTEI